ncbi:MAG TPA: hypothetical protein VK348_07225 [Planctomycetota bacterium]|nr:hypothetical protein [Planctomycetota bacterium]
MSASLVVLIGSDSRAQEPTFLGATLAQWRDPGFHPSTCPPPLLSCVAGDRAAAIAALSITGPPPQAVRLALEQIEPNSAQAVLAELVALPDATSYVPDLLARCRRLPQDLATTATLLAIEPQTWSEVAATVRANALAEMHACKRERQWPKPRLRDLRAFVELMLEHGSTADDLATLQVMLREAELPQPESLQTTLRQPAVLVPVLTDRAGELLRDGTLARWTDFLCEHTEPLAPLLSELHAEIGRWHLIEQREQSYQGAGCGNFGSKPHRDYARMLGAVGQSQLPYLRELLASDEVDLRECGLIGIGQMARRVRKARDVLIDHLQRFAEPSAQRDPRSKRAAQSNGTAAVRPGRGPDSEIFLTAERNAVLTAITLTGEPIVDPLVRLLTPARPAVSLLALEGLHRLWLPPWGRPARAPTRVELLLPLVEGPADSVQVLAFAIARQVAPLQPIAVADLPTFAAELRQATIVSPRLHVQIGRCWLYQGAWIVATAPGCQPAMRDFLRQVATTSPSREQPIPLHCIDMLAALRAPEWSVRTAACNALLTCRDPDLMCRAALRQLAGTDPDLFVRACARRTLRDGYDPGR